jgi:hypothetical protein
LIGLIKRQNPMATVFAAKTLLKDRGYGEKHEVVGTVNHTHTHQQLNINLSELDLPLDIQMIVMEAIEKRQKHADRGPTPLILEHRDLNEVKA